MPVRTRVARRRRAGAVLVALRALPAVVALRAVSAVVALRAVSAVVALRAVSALPGLAVLPVLVALVLATGGAAGPARGGGTVVAEQPSPQAALLPGGPAKPSVWGSRSDPRVAASRGDAPAFGGLGRGWLAQAGDPRATLWRPFTAPPGAGGRGCAGRAYQGRAPPAGRA